MANRWNARQICLCCRPSTRDKTGSGETPADASSSTTNDRQSADDRQVASDWINPVAQKHDFVGDTPTSSPPTQQRRTFREDQDKLKVHLRPHVHVNGVCERKKRVCSAPGRVREAETLEAMILEEGLSTPRSGSDCHIVWYRSVAARHPATTIQHGAEHLWNGIELGPDAFAPVDGCEGKAAYVLGPDDIGCFITAAVVIDPAHSSTGTTADRACCYALNCAGPVEPAPPRVSELRIEGEFREDKMIRAVYQYFGGLEGETEVWWMRVKNGVREDVTKPRPVPSTATRRSSRISDEEDPRNYCIKAADVGCILKVKVQAMRSDGYDGDVTTSKPTPKIQTADADADALSTSTTALAAAPTADNTAVL